MGRFGLRIVFVLALVIVTGLATPALANAERLNIERVVVSRDAMGVLTFRIVFASPVGLADESVQVQIDSDRDSGTGIRGFDYALDLTLTTRRS